MRKVRNITIDLVNIILFLLLMLIISMVLIAKGDDNLPIVKLQGSYEFQGTHYSNNISNSLPLTANQKNIGFISTGHINIDLKNTTQIGEYGTKLTLETTSLTDKKMGSLLYLTTDYGKLELGSDKSATNKMKVTSYSIACGTGGGWDTWPKLAADPKKVSYISNFGNFLDGKSRVANKSEYSRKITYFTPKIGDFQLGISYIPDSTNMGFGIYNVPETYKLANPHAYKFAITDGIGMGITHETNIDENTKIKTAIVGEKGKVKAYNELTNIKSPLKFKNLSTYTIGSELHYQQYASAVSYSNYMKSLTNANLDTRGRNTYLYGIGGRYKHDENLSTSLNYFQSNHKKNILKATTLAVDYKFIPGLLSYGEATFYTTHGRYLENAIIKKDKTNGRIFVLGTRIEF